ncbi:MAG: vitamin K epoxide reductase family protein [Vicinamibacterales bacterium]
MSTTSARLALLFALVGLGASVTAAYVHYRMFADPTYTSFCDVGATVSCTRVYASRFGTFRGVSVSVFGAVWFAFAGLLSVAGMTARPAVRESVPGYLFAASTAALAVILYLAYASFFVLKLVCVLCLLTYACVIGVFLISGAATPFSMLSLPRRAAADVKVLAASPLALALAALWLGGAATTLAFFPREVLPQQQEAQPGTAAAAVPEVTDDQRSELERFLTSAPRIPLGVPAEGAKVVVVKFADYQCPACGQAYQAYKPLFAKYEASNPGAVRLVHKDYPLNPDCNPAVSAMLHPAACDAAVAVRLAAATGHAAELEEWLYMHQPEMTPESVRRAAREIGKVTDFDARYQAAMAQVKQDIAQGQELKVTSTPTFFINGIKIDGAWAPQFFDQAIAYELQHAH